MAEFSLALNEDQLQIQKWVHDFAETVVRPAAHEWDEREEFPWPLVEEAAKIGLYSLRLLRPGVDGRPHRAHAADHARGAVLGRRRHRPVDLRLGPRRRRHRRQRHARAGDGVGAAVLRHRARRHHDRRLLRVRARRRLRRVVAEDARRSTTRPRTSGSSTAPRRGPPTAASPTLHVVTATVDPTLGSRGQASFIVPKGTQGHLAGPEVQEARHPRVAHRRGRARRLPGAGPHAARRQGEARRQAGQGARGPEDR